MTAAGVHPGDRLTGGPQHLALRVRAVAQRQRAWSGTLASSSGAPRHGYAPHEARREAAGAAGVSHGRRCDRAGAAAGRQAAGLGPAARDHHLPGRAGRDRGPADPAGRPQHHQAAADRHGLRQPGPGAARGVGLLRFHRLRRAVLLPDGAGSGQPAQDRVRHHHGRAVPVHADRVLRAGVGAGGRAARGGAVHTGRDQRRGARCPRLPGRPARAAGRPARDVGAAVFRLFRRDGQPGPGPDRAAGCAVPGRRHLRVPPAAPAVGRRGVRLRRADPGNGAARAGRARAHPARPDRAARRAARRRRRRLARPGRRFRRVGGRGESRDGHLPDPVRQREERRPAVLRRAARGGAQLRAPHDAGAGRPGRGHHLGRRVRGPGAVRGGGVHLPARHHRPGLRAARVRAVRHRDAQPDADQLGRIRRPARVHRGVPAGRAHRARRAAAAAGPARAAGGLRHIAGHHGRPVPYADLLTGPALLTGAAPAAGSAARPARCTGRYGTSGPAARTSR